MKILHISTGDAGGAGATALLIHNVLSESAMDIESKMLVSKKYSGGKDVYVAVESNLNKYIPPKNIIWRKIKNKLHKRGFYMTKLEKVFAIWSKIPKERRNVCFTFPITSYDLSQNEWVRWADIIHLHWVADFVDYETFFRNVNKPIVWTFHDENPLLGGFHNLKTKIENYEYYKQLEDYFTILKREAIGNKIINVVALSSYMKEKILASKLFNVHNLFLINNPIDYKEFTQIDKKAIRQVLGIPAGKTVFTYVSSTLNDPVKGLDLTIGALSKLDNKDVVLLCVGDGADVKIDGIDVRQFHHQNDRIWLSALFSAADYLLSTSYQESFGNVACEAMCCGTPVIITPTGIAKDLINESNGVLCEDFTPEAVLKAIKIAMGREYAAECVRSSVRNLLSPEIIAKKYYDLYCKVLAK